ncbi:MAG: cobaltochelatase subunit CobN [Bacteroides sp.]|nr:cobaltochelatase subunit CobN [Bacteroides sp.]
MTKKKIIFTSVTVIIIVAAAIIGWKSLASSTRIAFINYQPITLGEIGKANNSSFIKIENLDVEKLDKVSNFDMIFVNGMGLRITEEQRDLLSKAAEKGLSIITTAATNPDNLIISTDSVDTEFIKQYLQGSGRVNYSSMLNYVRKYIDGKKFFLGDIKDPIASPTGLLYHPDIKDPDGEEHYFNSLSDYNKFLMENNLLRNGATEIILTGQMGVPDELIRQLESTGNIVYPISNIQKAITSGVADSISPSAMINMAHGRMGDIAVEYLKRKNIPLFAPLNVNRDYDEWIEDKMGMNGGFMSQSIVTPEIDGAIRPWTLFAQYEGKDGVPEIKAIPGRLEEFVEAVNNYTSLKRKVNSDKKIAIFYFKGPGQNALVAEGMEVAPSLFNLLNRLKAEGYKVENMPSSAQELERLLDSNGRVFGQYAIGAMDDFVKNANPELINRDVYDQWARTALGEEMMSEIERVDGNFPGQGLKTEDGQLALARLQFGNVVLVPQTAAGIGDDEFKIVHGTDMAPPHSYVASYLWVRNGFGADALIHFGAHGSLEFTPRKQVALSSRDWSDRLVGTMPHFYVYSTSNVGEAMIAKRRSYAGIVNYLTPPFMESNVRGIYKNLSDAILSYNKELESDNPDQSRLDAASRLVKKYTVELGIHRELRLDSILSNPYSASEISRVEIFAEELANEKITGMLYVMGIPYGSDKLTSTVYAMTVDPIAYSLYSLDKLRGKVTGDKSAKGVAFTTKYLIPARNLVKKLLSEKRPVTEREICEIAGISEKEFNEAKQIMEDINGSKDLFSRMMVMGSSMSVSAPTAKLSERKESSTSKMKKMMNATGMSPEKALEMAKKMGADSAAIAKMGAAMKNKGSKADSGKHSRSAMMSTPQHSKNEIEKASAIMEIAQAITNVYTYTESLRESPEKELSSIINALNGGFISPTSGGDPVLNPLILPTGRNMFAVNAEETPSVVAWEKGKELADNTIKMYREAHNDSLPRKVSYTLWSSEFIETEGATIAQVLYMLGVEPVRDPFGRVTDLRLIPSEELGRPRIDVVVQTSGQLRDLAASRLFLITRAVEMASQSKDDIHPNYVAEGVMESERHLVDKGVSPKEAREMSTSRVFGGINGNYGSGIQEMVEAGDRWNDESQIAETYIHNMGASYGSEKDWEKMRDFAFEAALTRTDVVVQPRQSNTWGALSLDHVYEFMGGMNLAVRNITGKDPDAYLADYRNRNRARMQEVKEAVGVESRTTILNPAYISEKMKGGAGDASGIADVIRNTYGWNVMKPDAIDNELWDDIYDTYVNDKYDLGTKNYFKSVNPYALEEMTAVMLETIRKGMWKASDEQISTLAQLHTEIVDEYKPSCSGFVCNNSKLREFISSKVDASSASAYNKSIGEIRSENVSDDGMVMQKDELDTIKQSKNIINGGLAVGLVVVCLLIVFIIIKRRRKEE